MNKREFLIDKLLNFLSYKHCANCKCLVHKSDTKELAHVSRPQGGVEKSIRVEFEYFCHRCAPYHILIVHANKRKMQFVDSYQEYDSRLHQISD